MKSQNYTSLTQETESGNTAAVHYFVSKNSHQAYRIISVFLLMSAGFTLYKGFYELTVLILLVIFAIWGYAFSGIAVDK